jgi:ribosome-binding factor A
MAKSFRLEKINDAIKELLSELIFTRIKDPRIGFITITSVKIAPDLMSARVYYSVMGSESERQTTLEGLESAGNFLRKTVGRELRLRHAPELRFYYDDSLDKAIAIENALKEIKRKDSEDS